MKRHGMASVYLLTQCMRQSCRTFVCTHAWRVTCATVPQVSFEACLAGLDAIARECRRLLPRESALSLSPRHQVAACGALRF
jgi:hypothetical protein